MCFQSKNMKCTKCGIKESTGVLLTLCDECMDELEEQQENGVDIVEDIVKAQEAWLIENGLK